MATDSSILAWDIPWTEEPGGLQSVGGKDLDTPEQLSTQAGVCMCVYKLLLDWKRSVFIPTPKKGNAKECSNYCTIALISHASKVMLKKQLDIHMQKKKKDLDRDLAPFTIIYSK